MARSVKATKPQSIDNNKMNAHWRSSTSYCIGQEMSSVDCSTCEGHPQHSASGKQKKKRIIDHSSRRPIAGNWHQMSVPVWLSSICRIGQEFGNPSKAAGLGISVSTTAEQRRPTYRIWQVAEIPSKAVITGNQCARDNAHWRSFVLSDKAQ